jgi:two-component system phosphate regulon sensor histidine kinase PhoR
MKIPLFSKIFGGCLLIIVLFSALIPLLSFNLIKTHYIDTFTDNFKNLAITLLPEVTPLLERQKFQELDAYVKTLKNRIHTRITIIDSEGRVLADSEKDPKTMENHKIRPEVSEALSGSMGKSMRFSITVEENMLYVAIPIEKDTKISGVIRMSVSLRQIDSLLNELKKHILWIDVAMTVFSLAIAFMLSRGISAPVKTLVQAIKKISQGDFSAKIFLKNEDELKDLGDSINDMREQMRDLFADISGRNEELNTIISSMQEPLVVLDHEGIVKLSNESFKVLAGNELPHGKPRGNRSETRSMDQSQGKLRGIDPRGNNGIEGRFYWEAVRSPGFAELIKKAGTEKIYFSDEVRIHDRIFLGSVNFLISRNETVVVLHDITDLKNLEKIKKDFIANLSHELRTPLTAIKGFVETLEEEEDIKNRHYLEIIKRHTDRLMNIVRDLLLLSELEEKGELMEFEDVSIGSVIENILKIFENRANEKGLKIVFNVTHAIPLIKADPFKLEQIFINLIDNAVKYTEEGKITISINNDGAHVLIEIVDTGIGIPGEHLPRIFERFYVADKSRSKRLGGTGLGLSIVKHIVNLHNGKIEVESAPGKGTKFTVTLPINPA